MRLLREHEDDVSHLYDMEHVGSPNHRGPQSRQLMPPQGGIRTERICLVFLGSFGVDPVQRGDASLLRTVPPGRSLRTAAS